MIILRPFLNNSWFSFRWDGVYILMSLSIQSITHLKVSCFKNLESQNLFRVKPLSFVDAVFMLLISFNFSQSDFWCGCCSFSNLSFARIFWKPCWLELIFWHTSLLLSHSFLLPLPICYQWYTYRLHFLSVWCCYEPKYTTCDLFGYHTIQDF